MTLSLTLTLSAAVFYYVGRPSEPRVREILEVGSELPQTYQDQRHQTSRVFVSLVSTCEFCAQSVPFYRRLLDHSRRLGVEVVVLTVEPPEALRSSLFPDVDWPATIRNVPRLEVPGTPAIILADANGRVAGSWLGQLPPSVERQVLGKISALARKQ